MTRTRTMGTNSATKDAITSGQMQYPSTHTLWKKDLYVRESATMEGVG